MAKPLLDTFSASTVLEWHWRPFDVVLVAVLLLAVPPALLLAAELAAGLIDARARYWVHLAVVAVLLYLLAAYTLRKELAAGTGFPVFPVAAAVAAAATFAYHRFGGVRSFVTVLSVAPVVFLVVFLFGSSASKVVFPAKVAAVDSRAAPVPVVMVVFDEFPVSSLMRADGRLDSARLPNFAALARTSTWYRNAVTVHDYTRWAVPAIDSGRHSARKSSPVAGDHKRTLFELLARSHALEVFEGSERLCPTNLCPQRAPGSFPGRIPPLLRAATESYLTLALPRRFTLDIHPRVLPEQDLDADVARFTAALRRRPARPRFAYLHVLAPHAAFRYLPSGRKYVDPSIPEAVGPGDTPANRVLSDTFLRRHLAQVGYTDLLLGRILTALRQSGDFDRSLVVVTADHGISFRPGQEAAAHRDITTAIAPDILGVPLFVKAPRQRRGRVDDSYARTIDVAPTVAALLHAHPPWPFEGRPAGGAKLPPTLTVQPQRGPLVTIPSAAFLRGRAAQAARITRLLRTGAPVGAPLASLRVVTRAAPKVRLDDAAAFRSVDLGAEVPAAVTGQLTGAGADAVKRVAVAIDGHVAATAWTYADRHGRVRFAALTGDRWLRPGRNAVQVLAMPAARTAPLARLGQ